MNRHHRRLGRGDGVGNQLLDRRHDRRRLRIGWVDGRILRHWIPSSKHDVKTTEVMNEPSVRNRTDQIGVGTATEPRTLLIHHFVLGRDRQPQGFVSGQLSGRQLSVVATWKSLLTMRLVPSIKRICYSATVTWL